MFGHVFTKHFYKYFLFRIASATTTRPSERSRKNTGGGGSGRLLGRPDGMNRFGYFIAWDTVVL